MNTSLPPEITLGNLIRTFNFNMLNSPDKPEPQTTDIAIHALIFDNQVHVLPFPGYDLEFSPAEDHLLLRINTPHPPTRGRKEHGQQIAEVRQTLPIEIYLSKPDLSWADFCSEAINWLEREQGHILAKCEEYFQMLTRNLAEQHGHSVIHGLKTILGYDVFLLDAQLDVLDWAGGNYLPENPIEFFPPKIPIATSSPSSSTFINLFAGDWKAGYQGVPLTWCPLSGQQGILGYLGLAVKADKLGSVEYYFLSKATPLLTLELLKNQCIKENERQHHRDFLFDLLYNNFDSVEVICSRGRLWGWDLSKPHLVTVGMIQDFSPLPAERQTLDDFVNRIARTLGNVHPGTICLERNDQVVILFPLKEMLAQSQLIHTADRFLQPVREVANRALPGRKLFFGLGNLYPTARGIHRSFQEARTALDLGRLLYPGKLLTSFSELGIMRLLLRLDHQELEDFRTEILKPLWDFDHDDSLRLEQTLLTYFLCSCDLNQAAQRLFLHPNTLRYRLKKAAEILDRDISRLDNQLNLFIALQIDHLKALWSE